MKNKKTLILLILLLFSVFVYVFFIKSDDIGKKRVIENFQNNQIETPIIYSRINFFLSSGNKASLAIPDFWEGNYRIKEVGDSANFYFIKGTNEEIKLFSIRYREKNIKNNPDDIIIGTDDKYNYILNKEENTKSKDDVYYKIFESLNNTIKSFKAS